LDRKNTAQRPCRSMRHSEMPMSRTMSNKTQVARRRDDPDCCNSRTWSRRGVASKFDVNLMKFGASDGSLLSSPGTLGHVRSVQASVYRFRRHYFANGRTVRLHWRGSAIQEVMICSNRPNNLMQLNSSVVHQVISCYHTPEIQTLVHTVRRSLLL